MQCFFLLRAESTVRGWDKLFVVEVLPSENIVPEDADLVVPGMRDSVGGVYLLDDLLCLVGGIMDVEQGRHLGAILHVLPIVNVELNYLAEQLAQVRASFFLHSENCVLDWKVQRHCGG